MADEPPEGELYSQARVGSGDHRIMVRLYRAFRQLEVDLRQLRLRWALIGGLAVNVRAEPRTTKDLDIAVAVENERESEGIVGDFWARGYRLLDAPFERADMDRMAGVRLTAPGEDARGIVVDLLFAASGIEAEVVASADLLEILPGLAVPVATIAHLLALKTLAGRDKDLPDFPLLLPHATASDVQQAREALDLISRRGYVGDKDRDLQAEFAKHLKMSS